MPPVSMNPFQRLRMANMIGTPQPTQGRFGATAPPPVPHMQAQPQQRDDASRYYDDMTELQSHVGPGIQAYREHLSKMPDRNEYRPGIMNRIAAALSGMSAGYHDPGEGVRVAQEVNESPYKAAMTDYANRGVGLRAQADMEQDELDSKLKMLQNARAMGLKYDEFDLKRRESASKMENDRTTANAARTRAEAYAASQGKPRHQYRDQQDGSVLEINEDTGQQRVIPAHTVAAGQLGVSRSNAATSAARQKTYAGSVTEQGRHNKEMEKRPIGGRPSPNAQGEAEAMALDELAMDPDFKDFVKKQGGSWTGSGGYNTVGEDDGSEAYGIFLEALNAKVAEILSGNHVRGRTRER